MALTRIRQPKFHVHNLGGLLHSSLVHVGFKDVVNKNVYGECQLDNLDIFPAEVTGRVSVVRLCTLSTCTGRMVVCAAAAQGAACEGLSPATDDKCEQANWACRAQSPVQHPEPVVELHPRDSLLLAVIIFSGLCVIPQTGDRLVQQRTTATELTMTYRQADVKQKNIR